jgi:hypothetical protein
VADRVPQLSVRYACSAVNLVLALTPRLLGHQGDELAQRLESGPSPSQALGVPRPDVILQCRCELMTEVGHVTLQTRNLDLGDPAGESLEQAIDAATDADEEVRYLFPAERCGAAMRLLLRRAVVPLIVLRHQVEQICHVHG